MSVEVNKMEVILSDSTSFACFFHHGFLVSSYLHIKDIAAKHEFIINIVNLAESNNGEIAGGPKRRIRLFHGHPWDVSGT